jgi:hypothetical protein
MDADILAIDNVLSRLWMTYRHLLDGDNGAWRFVPDLGRDLLQALGSMPNDLDDEVLFFVIQRIEKALLLPALADDEGDQARAMLDDEIAAVNQTRDMIWED